MGGFISSQADYDDYTDTDSSCDSEEEGEKEDMLESDDENSTDLQIHKPHMEESLDGPDNCFDSATDAVNTSTQESIVNPVVINIDNVCLIEENLDLYEKVSLVYLLYSDPKLALQELNKCLNGISETMLSKWAESEAQHNPKWKEKFIEALCIIQNYQVLKSLGYKRRDLDDRFLPHYMYANENINKSRKALYLLCEELTESETAAFLEFIRLDFRKKGLEFKTFSSGHLELFLLHWEVLGYIKQDNLNHLYSVLKQLEHFDLVDKLKLVVPSVIVAFTKIFNDQRTDKIEKNRLQARSAEANKKSDSIFEEILNCKSVLDLKSNVSLDTAVNTDHKMKYNIDPENPGVCLIINQENFYSEVDPNCKHLLPPPETRLENRTGTQKDKEVLEQTFKMFNFKTEVVNNLTHTEIQDKIEEVIQSVTNESSLFICIMSHGDSGVIYGVNSCRVDVRAIKNKMCSKNRENLLGKPKVLILQSCQGNRCQKISASDEDVTTDGPTYGLPVIVDLFTFWATVPGYAAIRNKKTGSWFIQSLCEKMQQLGNKEHFEDICTAVIQDVTNKKWFSKEQGDVAMVPLKETTLRFRFDLPPIK